MNWTEKFNKVFSEFTYYHVFDILLISLVFYIIFAYLKHINSAGLIIYIIIGLLACAVVYIFRDQLKATYMIVAMVLINACVLFMLIYLPDIRRNIWKASSPRALKSNYNARFDCSDQELESAGTEIIKAIQNLAKTNTGALIVLTSNELSAQIVESGTRLDALVSAPLLESIFFPNSAMHDGAVLINGNKIVAAGCFLPLSQNLNVPKELGTRHRAALGVSEDTQVTTIIVSEETGIISVAKNGVLARYYDSHMLKDTIGIAFGIVAAEDAPKKKKRKK